MGENGRFQRAWHAAKEIGVDLPGVRFFFGARFAADAIRNLGELCEVGLVGSINDHFASVSLLLSQVSSIVAILRDYTGDPIRVHFHIDRHFIETRGDGV